MTESPAVDWIEPHVGFAYNPQTVVFAASEQARALGVCGIDPQIFGGKADPSFFIAIAIQAGVASGISANGSVNMVQHLIQHAPLNLDEEIQVEGRVLTVADVPRGKVVTSEVDFTGADGRVALTARRSSLRPDPAKSTVRGAGERPPPVVENPAALRKLDEFALTPETVRAYRSEGNPIHYDPDAARRAGFRAPIIGGGMGVHYLMAALWRGFAPRSLNVDIYFRRPIFWDDRFTVMVDDRNGTWRAMCLAKDGKVATEARINSLNGQEIGT